MSLACHGELFSDLEVADFIPPDKAHRDLALIW